jgi:hypothetical protein
LRARYAKHAAALAQVGFMLKGSVVQRFLPCGNPGCRCHGDPPQLHGPYWQWTSKVRGKTVTRMLSGEHARRYHEWIANWKRFEQIAETMHDLSAQADALLRTPAPVRGSTNASQRSRSSRQSTAQR